MQVSKAKSGYKFVDAGFGKEIEIPEEWDFSNFKDFVSLKHGYAFESKDFVSGKGIKIIKIGDIQKDNSINIENLDGISIETAKGKNEFSIQKGDILMALTGATLGKTGILKTDEKLLQNQRVGNIFPTESKKLDKTYLFYVLISDFVQKQIWSFVSTSAQPNIGKSELDKIIFFKPKNILEQQKIISILSNIDNTLEKTNLLIEKLKILKQGLSQKLFTKGIGHTKFKKVEWLFGKEIEIPEEWEIKNLDILCSQIVDGPHVSPKYVEDGIPFLTVNNVMDGFINLENVKFISNEDHQIFSKRAKPVIGDILYTKGGTTGIAKIVDVDFEFSIWVHLALLKVKNDVIDSKYLELFLNSYLGKKQAKLHTYGIANKDLVLGRMKQILVNLPSLSEQKQIAEILSNVDSQINKEKLNKVNLESLKKGLMQKLLTGQIRVKV